MSKTYAAVPDRERINSARWIAAQEEERARIARELHDEVGQQLTAILLELNVIKRSRAKSHRLHVALKKIGNQIREVSDYLHDLSRHLHPAILDYSGLIAAIRSLCAVFAKREGIRVDLHIDNPPAFNNKAAALSLYRVLQEALQNIRKHSHSRNAKIRIATMDDSLLLSVRDFGVGITSEVIQSQRRPIGLGITSMYERISLLGGSLTVNSSKGWGTELLIKVPREEIAHIEGSGRRRPGPRLVKKRESFGEGRGIGKSQGQRA